MLLDGLINYAVMYTRIASNTFIPIRYHQTNAVSTVVCEIVLPDDFLQTLVEEQTKFSLRRSSSL